jgi:hypothetical protein
MISTKGPRPLNLLAYDQQVISVSLSYYRLLERVSWPVPQPLSGRISTSWRHPNTLGGAALVFMVIVGSVVKCNYLPICLRMACLR